MADVSMLLLLFHLEEPTADPQGPQMEEVPSHPCGCSSGRFPPFSFHSLVQAICWPYSWCCSSTGLFKATCICHVTALFTSGFPEPGGGEVGAVMLGLSAHRLQFCTTPTPSLLNQILAVL